MTEYRLYLESGPKMKTTMVHVLDLLGCIANGPTTEAALDATPDEIRHFLRFLKRHGEKVDPDGEFETSIAEHVTEGSYIGYGNPPRGFAPDFQVLPREELALHLRRLGWIGDELAAIARDLSPGQLAATPEKGRPLHEALRHTVAAHAEFVRVSGLAKSDEMKELVKTVERSPDGLGDNTARMFALSITTFETATDEELTQVIQRGAAPYTARRGLRRGLEHAWEHLREIERRLDGAKS